MEEILNIEAPFLIALVAYAVTFPALLYYVCRIETWSGGWK